MPVVELSYSRLQKLIGNVTKKQISDSLPFLGLDIESEDGDSVRIEYSPNRPDYSTDYGSVSMIFFLFAFPPTSFCSLL